MKHLIFIILFFFCCLHANSQDYLKLAGDCFDKGDYECAKRNYTFFQTFEGSDMNEQIQIADECYKTLIIADAFYNEKEFEKARDRYQTVLEKNPNDIYAKKQYDLCINEINRLTSDNTVSQTKNQLNIEMVAVQGGSFTMGCTSEQGADCEKNEIPSHQVSVSDFYIGKYEVTQAQWKAVMGKNPSKNQGDSLPVENVSWTDVQKFISCLNDLTGKEYRLPSEAEWEFAARGGNKSKKYKYCGSNELDNVAWYSSNSVSKTHVIGSKSANELGIHDMSGNVLEWCGDLYGLYSNNAKNNPKGPVTGSTRVIRGGSWNNYSQIARVSYRYGWDPNYRSNNLGFRLALSSN